MTNTPADLCCGGVLVLTFLMLCFALYSLQNGVNEFLDAGLLFFPQIGFAPQNSPLSCTCQKKVVPLQRF